MSIEENYRDRTFKVTDPDARIRIDGDFLNYEKNTTNDRLPPGGAIGDFKRIPKGTVVSVIDVAVEPAGSQSNQVFARVTSATGNEEYGWTSSVNFENRFRNTTLGLIAPAHGAGKYSDTARWKSGQYVGQVSLVRIVDKAREIEFITEEIAGPFSEMISEAAGDGIGLAISSGFRTYAQQKYFWEGYVKKKPGFNKAAKPGYSNHQNGIALDIPVGGINSARYSWLATNATGFGFLRTVKGEPWHWEYRPQAAEKARKAGKHMI